MRRAVGFIVALVCALALLTWAAWTIVQQTTRGWFERDLALRAQLVVNGARPALAAAWQDRPRIDHLLDEIARDERIMAVAACGADGSLLAATANFPDRFSCAQIHESLPTPEEADGVIDTAWAAAASLPGGRVHLSAVPLFDRGRALGSVALVHDLRFLERRDATTRRFLLIAFGFLAIAASALTAGAAHFAWRRWSDELRRTLRGEDERPEFLPILRDVRELTERLAAEREADRLGGVWTPERLKQALNRHLQGEKIVIVANREPYIHTRTADGGVKVLRPASGLVTALEPVMRACSGVWVAHGIGSADRDVVDAHDRVHVPPGEESYFIRRIWLSDAEERGYYYGFANEGLWPLCHIADTRPTFRGDDWQQYRAVNEKFVAAVCDEVDSEDPIILVQDYHFALAPRMIRERLPRATVITFWHVPWPNSERAGICPWRTELLHGLLGSSILGFHTQFHCNNFLDTVDRYLEARIDREQHAVVREGHNTLVRPYPISIEWPSRWAAQVPPAPECRASVIAELGLGANALLGVGVDRLDYTKGVEERLLAVERLLERSPALRGRLTFLQLAAPSRTEIERYRQLNDQIEQLAARINGRFGGTNYRPVVLLRAHHEPVAIFRYYRAADVCYVSSLHDGMNLVAKEFVAARDDECGVLVLSQFTGAARELTEALIVNPYDLEQASDALATALAMPAGEQRERMRSMRAFLAEFNVYRWAGRMLVDAARLRRRERLADRLTPALLMNGVGPV